MADDEKSARLRRRDFSGYRDQPIDPMWPGKARVALSFVVNVEEGAELSVGDGDERNECVHEVVEEVRDVPDRCMESHFEYGARVGYWRIADLLDRYKVKATFSASARALERSPWMAKDIVRRGHEVSAHSYRWERHANMSEDEERQVIARTVETIRDAAGHPPAGWHTRSSSSENTRRLLIEHGGFEYDSDAYNDDLPWVAEVAGQPHVVLPYAFDTNDMRFTRQAGFVFGEDFFRYCRDAFDWLWAEGERTPRMMSVGLHLRIIGRPGRIGGLDRLLAHICSHDEVWVAKRLAIARHWREKHLG